MDEHKEPKSSKSLLAQLKNKQQPVDKPAETPSDSKQVIAEPETPHDTTPGEPNQVAEPAQPAQEVTKAKPTRKKQATEHGTVDEFPSFTELHKILKSEKEFFTFNKRTVYIDDDIADVLDLLRKKEKINSNLLTSFLLQQFFIKNKGLIQELRDRKENRFLD
ncbi:hypothetical protein [Rufibacter sp. XAAS-G3-1]|uniref:hypothetical protein n=1 Tax=Rufibacter sp. XAAS-G3-1 TaxID=2729134 RepID=UPI0015E6A461|nr:hypothetical protein [Rufibacter sp. XAAS-G3-1]